MTFKEIQDLIKLIHKYDLAEFMMKEADFELRVRTSKYKKEAVSSIITNPTPVMQASAPPPAVPAQVPVSPPEEVAPGSQSEADADKDFVEIKSPIVGTFYRSSSPDKAPYAKVGDPIEVGSVVCIIEAMKLFNEIESEVAGKIVKVLVEDASPVEYDQVMFLVDPKG